MNSDSNKSTHISNNQNVTQKTSQPNLVKLVTCFSITDNISNLFTVR